jgi:hypothetical protein
VRRVELFVLGVGYFEGTYPERLCYFDLVGGMLIKITVRKVPRCRQEFRRQSCVTEAHREAAGSDSNEFHAYGVGVSVVGWHPGQ